MFSAKLTKSLRAPSFCGWITLIYPIRKVLWSNADIAEGDQILIGDRKFVVTFCFKRLLAKLEGEFFDRLSNVGGL